MNEMVVKGLFDGQLLDRTLEQRDRDVRVFARQCLHSEIDLSLQIAIEVTKRTRDIDGLLYGSHTTTNLDRQSFRAVGARSRYSLIVVWR